ncbi:hypothetical protein WMW72_16385 [Paenibacillus filicis]|uniref:BsuBI/PstI restriction endonuclease HTH domain-containing protein n=1 Tax=Paenibacillus filicis TaxID=669464 RepID=A0ABU9DKY2_9BACL
MSNKGVTIRWDCTSWCGVEIYAVTFRCPGEGQQAQVKEERARYSWLENNLNRKNKEKDIPGRWYKENTRESIRDETIRALVHLGAIVEKSGLATTSPSPRYTLQTDFAELFNPLLVEEELNQAIVNWQESNLSAIARARIAISKNMATSIDDGVLVQLPNGEVRKLSPGPSSILQKLSWRKCQCVSSKGLLFY